MATRNGEIEGINEIYSGSWEKIVDVKGASFFGHLKRAYFYTVIISCWKYCHVCVGFCLLYTENGALR